MITGKGKAFIVYWEQERQRGNDPGQDTERPADGHAFSFCGIAADHRRAFNFARLGTARYIGCIERQYCGRGGSPVHLRTVLFVFPMHYKWEMNEQLYRELKARTDRPETT